MPDSTCADCSSVIVQPTSSGRPRKYCFVCRPRKAGYVAVDRVEVMCACGQTFLADGRRRFCSEKCRSRAHERRNKRVRCSTCDGLVWVGGASAAEPRCRTCRTPEHGTLPMYDSRKCRCDQCRAAKAASMRAYAVRRAADGNPLPRGGSWISRRDRIAIYLRDDLTCQLCFQAVRFDVLYMHPLAPTLDHIMPRSLGGSDDHANLRLACRQCNTSRGANLDWSPHGVQDRDAAVAV